MDNLCTIASTHVNTLTQHILWLFRYISFSDNNIHLKFFKPLLYICMVHGNWYKMCISLFHPWWHHYHVYSSSCCLDTLCHNINLINIYLHISKQARWWLKNELFILFPNKLKCFSKKHSATELGIEIPKETS